MTTLTVGNGQQFSTISAAVAAAHAGDTIDVQAGTYTNDFPSQINGLTIEGVGGVAKLVATVSPGNGKAIFDVAGNTTLKNLDFSGASVPDANGAGVRYESGNLVIQNSSFHDNQDGILGAADPNGTITINGSEFYGNGIGNGTTHNIYIGDIAQFTISNSYIHDVNTGHEIKSRAENNVISNNRIADNGGTGSYEIDLPNGGNANISGNTIQKSANSGNHVSVSYGEEGSLHAGATVVLTNNVFVSDGSGADVLNDAGGGTVTATGNAIWNFAAIDKAGRVGSAGFTALASRPALDTGSPISAGSASSGSSSPGGASGSGTPSAPPATPAADTTAPTLSAAESRSGLSNQTSVTLSGQASDSGSGVARVEIYDTLGGLRTDLGSATLAADGSWSFGAGKLADGSHAFTAIGTDRAGNASAAISAGPADIVDTTAPSLTVSADGGGRTTVISGTVSDPIAGVAKVEIYDLNGSANTDLGSATLSNGSWTFTATNLAAGTHWFSAAATDKAGNAGRAVFAGTPSTVTAPAPVAVPATPVAAPADTTPPSLTASQAASGPTNRTTDVLSGTVSDAGSGVARVEIYDTLGGVTADLGSATIGNGTWSFTTGKLADGSHQFAAVASDKAGNATGRISTGAALLVDTAAPSMTAAQVITGRTSQTSNVIFGTASDAGSGVARVEVYDLTHGNVADLGSATLNNGAWRFNAANLGAGDHYFSAAAIDNAGNSTRMVYTGIPQTVV